MLYVLLSLIAVGVLLASPAGQALLEVIIALVVLGVILYLCFWLTILVLATLGGVFKILSGIIPVVVFVALYYFGKRVIRDAKQKKTKVGNFLVSLEELDKSGKLFWGMVSVLTVAVLLGFVCLSLIQRF